MIQAILQQPSAESSWMSSQGGNPDFVAAACISVSSSRRAPAGLGLSAAISAFWTNTVTLGQVTEPAYEQIADLHLNQIVVMGYCNYAGTSDGTQGDGVVCLDEDVIQCANSASPAWPAMV
jgi:hypothetical protein